MTKMGIWATILAVTLTTGLLVGSISSTYGTHPICPPYGKFIQIDGGEAVEITGYTYSTTPEKGKKSFMFEKEVDEELSAHIKNLVEKGQKVTVKITVCKEVFNNDGTSSTKTHMVTFSDVVLTEVTESADADDDFPSEKVTGTYGKVEQMTMTEPRTTD